MQTLFSISISASCCFFSSDSGLHWNLGNAFTFCRVCAHNQYKWRKIFGIFKIYFFVHEVSTNGEQISEIENIYHTQSAQMEIDYESSENISFLSPQFLRHKRRRTLLQLKEYILPFQYNMRLFNFCHHSRSVTILPSICVIITIEYKQWNAE